MNLLERFQLIVSALHVWRALASSGNISRLLITIWFKMSRRSMQTRLVRWSPPTVEQLIVSQKTWVSIEEPNIQKNCNMWNSFEIVEWYLHYFIPISMCLAFWFKVRQFWIVTEQNEFVVVTKIWEFFFGKKPILNSTQPQNCWISPGKKIIPRFDDRLWSVILSVYCNR